MTKNTARRAQLSEDAIEQLQSILGDEEIAARVVEKTTLAAGLPNIEKPATIKKDLLALQKTLGKFVETEENASPWAGHWVNHVSRNCEGDDLKQFSTTEPFQPSEKMLQFMTDARALSDLLELSAEQFDVQLGRRRNTPAFLIAASVLRIFQENDLNATLSDNGQYMQALFVIFDELLPTEKSEAYRVSRQHLWNRFSSGLRECFCSS